MDWEKFSKEDNIGKSELYISFILCAKKIVFSVPTFGQKISKKRSFKKKFGIVQRKNNFLNNARNLHTQHALIKGSKKYILSVT